MAPKKPSKAQRAKARLAPPERREKSTNAKPPKKPNRPRLDDGSAAPRPVQPGDVYAYPLPDGRFGAVRILAVKGTSQHVAHTPYIGAKPPRIDDPQLLEVLRQHRFAFKGSRAEDWLDGKPGPELIRVGHIALTAAEQKQQCNAYAGAFKNIYPEVHAEWRWAHDRASFEREMGAEQEADEAERTKQRARPQKPEDPMADRSFWRLIDLLAWDKSGDDDAVIGPLVAELGAGSERRIRQFAETLSHKLYLLDTRAHAEHMGEDGWKGDDAPFSVDAFLYARCVVVANGEAFYAKVLSDPTAMPQDLEFEALLGVPGLAWELKTGDDPEWSTAVDHETFANGAGWR